MPLTHIGIIHQDPTFLIVDDRSTDGTAELLADQPDVTVFRPLPHSHFPKPGMR